MNPKIIAFFHLIHKIEAQVVAWSVLAIAAMTIANVATRSLLGDSLAVAEELSQFCIIVLTFVGMSYAAGLGRHIRMTAITEQLPAGAARRWGRLVHALTALLMLTLAGYACRYVYAVYQLGGVYPVTRVPFFVVYLIAPVGLALTALRYAAWAIGGRPNESGGPPA